MDTAVIVRGRVTDSRHIELDEPVGQLEGAVEVTLRPVPPDQGEDIVEFLARLPGGTRTKEDIDRQVREERDSWERDR
jgi:actin-like ATPase involved in cell morphogenesis